MPKTTFINGNKAQGITGTRVTAEFLNAVNNHRHTGLDVDGAGVLDYTVATGSDNAYVLTLAQALAALVTGMPIFFKANHTNTGAATLNIDGLGAVSLRNCYNQTLAAGDIRSGQIVVVVYDGTYFQVINNPKPQFRGCLLYMVSGSQAVSGGMGRLYFDGEHYDTDAMHDNTSNTSRITVPAGASWFKLRASLNLEPEGEYSSLVLIKNGDLGTWVATSTLVYADYPGKALLITPPVAVTAGDYFELWLKNDGSPNSCTAYANSAFPTEGFSAEVSG